MVNNEMPRGKYPVVQIAGVSAESLKKEPVYLCGKIDGTTDYYQRFSDAKKLLKRLGFEKVFNPVEIVICADITERKKIMGVLSGYVIASGSLCHLPGWTTSPGAKEETLLAKKFGLIIFDIVGDSVKLSPNFLTEGV